MDKFGVVTRALNVAVTGTLLIVSGWMYHRQPDQVRKAFLLRTAAFLFPLIDVMIFRHDQYDRYPSILIFLLALAPGAAAIFMIFHRRKQNRSLMGGLWLFVPLWIVSEFIVHEYRIGSAPVQYLFLLKGVLWIYLLFWIERKKPDQKSTEALCWHAWSANAVLIFFGWYFSENSTLNFYAFRYWLPLLAGGLPFLLTGYLRILAAPEKCSVPLIRAFLKRVFPYRVSVYFAGCMVLYIVFACDLSDVWNSGSLFHLSTCAYYLFLPVLVYWMETSAEQTESGSLKGQKVNYSAMALFVFAGVLSALTLRSTMKVMYDVHPVSDGTQTDSFEPLQDEQYYVSKEDEKIFFLPSEDEEASESESALTYGIGYAFYANRICFALYVIAVTALSAMLIRRNTHHPSADRVGIYISAGYLIRLVLFILYAEVFTLSDYVPLPFFGAYLMELILLAAFLAEKPEPEQLL
jgi:ABC-type Fe3+-siderophore transport system permease subunit